MGMYIIVKTNVFLLPSQLLVRSKNEGIIEETIRNYYDHEDDYYSEDQYAVSIKEDTAYPCLHSPKTTKERRSIRRIQKKSIRRIEDIVCEYSGRYQTWSLLQETPIRLCNANVKHSVLNANFELIYATCHECMFDAIHDLCVRDYLFDVNARVNSQSVKSRNAKSKKKKMWKPTGKVYTNVGYRWKPTGRIFTIDGNTCPLTRIISTKVVSPRKSISITLVKQTQPSSNKSRKIKDITNVGSSSKSKTVGSKISNHSEPMKNWGSNVSTAPSSSRVNFSKFLGTVRFGNNQIAKIIGYGDYQLGNVTISRVYYVEGLEHNLFSVGQFCDSDLEVAFRKHTCYVRNLEGADLLSGSRDTNLYTISLDDMLKSSPICLLSKASKTKSWLWHRRLFHLNFGTLNQLAKQGLVRGLPKLKFKKDHLCLACSLGKSKKSSHKPKADDTNQEKLYLLHMDLCGPMRVESINGKKYILVIVDDYSRFTWVKFLRSKDEAPEVIIKYLKQIQVRMNATVLNIRTVNGTEFVNQTLTIMKMSESHIKHPLRALHNRKALSKD
ncbi:retrovirus-related pol polyprotein from transposon TNT 1-94 [Tanacetum coccineum]